MNKKLTTDQTKIDLVAKLVKDGAIDFVEAIKLLEIEVEKEYIYYPYQQDTITWPQPNPIWYGGTPPYQVTCFNT